MKPYKILIFTLLVITLLAALCMFFPREGVNIGGKRLLFPSLEDVLTAQTHSNLTLADADVFRADSLKNALNDTLALYRRFFETHPARFYLPDDNPDFFNAVFQKMECCRRDTSPVHILHYGDSQIEADRISGLLRQRLQERFGG
ncbi:MAG: hypothetical protein LBN23_02065, partial [Paludibacter sp.]|nr:hypothetical protein [Paludibacter sp.]